MLASATRATVQADRSRRSPAVTDRRNPRFLRGFSEFNVYLAAFASAVSTSEGLSLRTLRERLTSDDFCSPQNLRRHVACSPSATGDICCSCSAAASLLTRSMIVSTPVVATPVRRRPRLISHSCGEIISDQGSRRALQPLGHGRIPLGGCPIGHRDGGRAAPIHCHDGRSRTRPAKYGRGPEACGHVTNLDH